MSDAKQRKIESFIPLKSVDAHSSKQRQLNNQQIEQNGPELATTSTEPTSRTSSNIFIPLLHILMIYPGKNNDRWYNSIKRWFYFSLLYNHILYITVLAYFAFLFLFPFFFSYTCLD